VPVRARCIAAFVVVASVLAVPAAVPAVALAPAVIPSADHPSATPAAATPAAAAPGETPAAAVLQRTIRIGIGDQKADMFADPRFRALGVKYARLAISWDVLHVPWQVAQLDAWMAGARAAGVSPLLSFGHSRVSRRSLPTPVQLRLELRRLLRRYPWATTYATWNEANHCGEPTCHRTKLVAAYYRALRAECRSCTILTPELLDMPNMTTWARIFVRRLGFTPKLWGVHNYVEANRFRMRRLRALLRALPRAEIWLTETGGLVRRDNGSATKLPEGPSHAAEVTRFLFDRVLPANPQVKAIYLYHWNAGPPGTTWDSALITPGGRERTALTVLRRVLRSGLRPHASFRSQVQAR
jgi:hypothetical protein